MKTISSFNSDKFVLGKLCKRNHEYQSSGCSLRRIQNRECVQCKSHSRLAKQKLAGHYLGNLCKRGHNYNQSGKSIRERKTNDCVECHKLRNYRNKRSSYYCPDYFRYRTWLRNPQISLTVAELVENEAFRRHKENKYQWVDILPPTESGDS